MPGKALGKALGDAGGTLGETVDAATSVRHRQPLARKYSICGRLTLFGGLLRRESDGTVEIRVTS
ncbi:hypothetical protein QFZ75_002027 [Streptomyces sp. V3I8]|nr:hypothetical protein [Streptomyces sp. V3I8]